MKLETYGEVIRMLSYCEEAFRIFARNFTDEFHDTMVERADKLKNLNEKVCSEMKKEAANEKD